MGQFKIENPLKQINNLNKTTTQRLVIESVLAVANLDT